MRKGDLTTAKQDKPPAWVRENVPNDAVRGETYVIAQKEQSRRLVRKVSEASYHP